MLRPPTLSLSSLILLFAASLGGCSELSQYLGEDCRPTADRYDEVLASEGLLSEDIGEEPPFPMALILSQDSINEIFREVAENGIDPITIRIGQIAGVTVKVRIRPELPLIQIENVPDCETCIVTEVGFELSFIFEYGLDDLRVSGGGWSRYQFPIRVDPEGDDATHVYGDFDRSRFQEIDLRISDFSIPFTNLNSNQVLDQAEPLIRDYLNGELRDHLSSVKLFTLDPWVIGNNDVKLIGRGPYLYPEHRTLVLGIHTNLIRPLDESVDIEPSLPEGADIGMQFHPELLQTMIQRMMHEGHVPRRYDDSGRAMPGEGGSPDEMGTGSTGSTGGTGAGGTGDTGGGGFEVTLSTLETSLINDEYLSTGITLWRTGGGICGSAELRAEIAATVGDGGLALTAQSIRVEEGEGLFGTLAETADDWLNSDFMRDLINISEFTLNYREMNLPNNKKAEMSAETFRLEIGGNGLNIFLNLDAIVEQE